MLRNLLITAWRQLVRRAAFSLINISGLAIGIAACVLICLYVHQELTYDRFNTKADRIVRVVTKIETPEAPLQLATGPLRLGDLLKKEYPEVEDMVRLHPLQEGISYRGEVLKESHFNQADQSVFSVFTFSFLEGKAQGSLEQPNSIVLTHSMELKYFGHARALGGTLVCNGQSLKVTGVVADLPVNSDYPIDALVSADLSKGTTWTDDDAVSSYLYVLFRHKPDLKSFTAKLLDISNRIVQPEMNKDGASQYHMKFIPELLTDVHYGPGRMADTPKGSRPFNFILALLALVILVIALLNYINLSTAKASERAKEVGVRKVNGAGRGQLIRQFLLESFLLVTLAWILALGLVALGLPFFDRLLNMKLPLTWKGMPWQAAGLFAATVLLSGLYPAFVLSSFKPAMVLKGAWKPGGFTLRKIITVAQFCVSAVLIMGTLIIHSQMRYMAHKDLGFQMAQLINLTPPTDNVPDKGDSAFIQALKEEPGIQGITSGTSMITGEIEPMSSTDVYDGRKKVEFVCPYFFIDTAFLSLLHIPIVQGRNFSNDMATDRQEAFLVNEAFVKKMGWHSPIGQAIEGSGHKGHVIGVVGDFYYKSLHNALQPLALIYNTSPSANIIIKAQPAELTRVRALWKQYLPGIPFDYIFMDQQYADLYQKDRTTMTLFNAFTLLAVFVSCLGLYGLISLVVLQRTKEIGIRKVLGSSVGQLVRLLLKGQLALIALAALIALPIAGVAAHRWLGTYANHTGLSWWMFVAPIVLTLGIAILATGYRVWLAARANPVQSLRSE
jgi:putative ABC transport system permease protein